MNRLKKGDDVVVVTGKSKGHQGRVLRLVGENRVLVENANIMKKHTKPDQNRGIQGGIIEMEAPLHVSNVMIFNAATGKPDRVGYKFLDDGKKVRIFRSTGESIDI